MTRALAPLETRNSHCPVHGDACFTEILPLSVAELFQSQGCESCPPALPLIHSSLKSNVNALLLTYNVTYFDARTGWTDTHGNAAWDARQQAYVKNWGRNGVFTPQVIVDGVADGVGRKEGEVTEILSKAIEARNASELAVGVTKTSENELRVASETAEATVHDVLLIMYDAKGDTVKVGKGPNKGKKMVHLNIVKDMVKIDEWSGGVRNVVVPEVGSPGLNKVVIVQEGSGGRIVAASKI